MNYAKICSLGTLLTVSATLGCAASGERPKSTMASSTALSQPASDASQYVVSRDTTPELSTVYDTKTGYTWQYGMSSGMLSYSEAEVYCARYSAGGLSAGAWHLPTADEAETLVNLDFVRDSRGYHPRNYPASTFPEMRANQVILTSATPGTVINMDMGLQHYSHTDISTYEVKCVSN